MLINIFNKQYELKPQTALKTKKHILDFLDKIHEASIKGEYPEYYTITVIMMYIISASILQSFSVEDLEKTFSE